MQVESRNTTPFALSSRRMTLLTALAVFVLGGGAGALLLPGILHGRLSPLFLALPSLTLAPAPLFSLSHQRSEERMAKLNEWLTSPLELPGYTVEGREFARDCRLALIRLEKLLAVEGFSKEEVPGIEATRMLTAEKANELYQKLTNIKGKFREMNLDAFLSMVV